MSAQPAQPLIFFRYVVAIESGQLMKLFRRSKDSQRSAKFELQYSFFRILMEVLSKEMIRQWILPALTFSAHGRPSVVEPVELMEVIR